MREITKREQVVTYMKKNSIDLLCLQETIPSSSIVRAWSKGINMYLCSLLRTQEEQTTTEWAFATTGGLRSTENHYLQHSSHLAEIEINMHGNTLVALSAYMPHHAPNEIKRLTAWEEMFNRISDISNNKTLVLGDLNAAIHARTIGEEACLGPHIWGKCMLSRGEKEGLLPESMNRSVLMDLLREHDMRCMNTCFQKPNNKKASCRYMWARGMQGPWDTDRHSELDLCLVFRNGRIPPRM